MTQIYRSLWPYLVVGGFLLVLKWVGAPKEAEIEQLRIQFNLPQTAVIDPLNVKRAAFKEGVFTIEGIARFDERQFQQYSHTIRRSNGWPLRPVVLDEKSFGGAAPATTVYWNELSSSRRRAWGNLSDDEAQAVTRGMALCYVLISPSKDVNPDRFVAQSCGDETFSGNPVIVVQGLLDRDTRALHMLIGMYGFPLSYWA